MLQKHEYSAANATITHPRYTVQLYTFLEEDWILAWVQTFIADEFSDIFAFTVLGWKLAKERRR